MSRATAAKYVMLPTGEVIPFSHFFVANLSIKDVIKELVEHETTPLTDQELADLLKGRDYHGGAAHRRQISRAAEHPAIDVARVKGGLHPRPVSTRRGSQKPAKSMAYFSIARDTLSDIDWGERWRRAMRVDAAGAT